MTLWITFMLTRGKHFTAQWLCTCNTAMVASPAAPRSSPITRPVGSWAEPGAGCLGKHCGCRCRPPARGQHSPGWRVHTTGWAPRLCLPLTCPPACTACPALPLPCRHDYCGVQEDLRNWWPKLRRGGIFAGHDYLTADSPAVVDSNQDWSCECTAGCTAICTAAVCVY
jgi:hypothetical protein